jgi:class 3 adenylate cyclase/pimeloyl-ACP methyl ester carboxylesterase
MSQTLSVILAADMAGFSRLVEIDEAGTLARQRGYLKTLVAPALAAAGGEIVKRTGDGFFARFPSLAGGVGAALQVQAAMAQSEAEIEPDRAIRYRIAIHLGDVSFDDGDLFGDTVNLTARIEALSEPGGVCLSDPAYQLLDPSQQERFSDLGLQRLKNIRRLMRVWQWTPQSRNRQGAESDLALTQKIAFCTAQDGAQLAYASVGDGPPVLKAPNWMNHLDFDWRSTIMASSLKVLAANNRLVRFDQRGNGLSDWDVEDISEDAMISDMHAIARAAGLTRYALFGQSQGCAFSVRYAAEHPDEISCLVLLSGYARGVLMRGSAEQARLHEATRALIREGWGSLNPAYRHVFTETMIPDAAQADKNQMDEIQRLATSPDCAARINDMNARIDVTDYARQLRVPTLVMHSSGDRRVPFDEGRRLAALIPGAEFVALPGSNHVPLDGSEAHEIFQERTRAFLARHAQ